MGKSVDEIITLVYKNKIKEEKNIARKFLKYALGALIILDIIAVTILLLL